MHSTGCHMPWHSGLPYSGVVTGGKWFILYRGSPIPSFGDLLLHTHLSSKEEKRKKKKKKHDEWFWNHSAKTNAKDRNDLFSFGLFLPYLKEKPSSYGWKIGVAFSTWSVLIWCFWNRSTQTLVIVFSLQKKVEDWDFWL